MIHKWQMETQVTVIWVIIHMAKICPFDWSFKWNLIDQSMFIIPMKFKKMTKSFPMDGILWPLHILWPVAAPSRDTVVTSISLVSPISSTYIHKLGIGRCDIWGINIGMGDSAHAIVSEGIMSKHTVDSQVSAIWCCMIITYQLSHSMHWSCNQLALENLAVISNVYFYTNFTDWYIEHSCEIGSRGMPWYIILMSTLLWIDNSCAHFALYISGTLGVRPLLIFVVNMTCNKVYYIFYLFPLFSFLNIIDILFVNSYWCWPSCTAYKKL